MACHEIASSIMQVLKNLREVVANVVNHDRQGRPAGRQDNMDLEEKKKEERSEGNLLRCEVLHSSTGGRERGEEDPGDDLPGASRNEDKKEEGSAGDEEESITGKHGGLGQQVERSGDGVREEEESDIIRGEGLCAIREVPGADVRDEGEREEVDPDREFHDGKQIHISEQLERMDEAILWLERAIRSIKDFKQMEEVQQDTSRLSCIPCVQDS